MPLGAEADTVANRCIAPDDAYKLADEVLELVNLERASVDVAPVLNNAKLQKIASDYACKMIEENFFGHRDPKTGYGPKGRAVAGRYQFHAIGENLAAGQETPAEVVRAWMESPAHKLILLDPSWTELGVSVRFGGEHSVYWVQEFGDPFDN